MSMRRLRAATPLLCSDAFTDVFMQLHLVADWLAIGRLTAQSMLTL